MTDQTVDNVLLITYDSLRYDVWNQIQDSLVAGPRMEQEGLSFTRAFATGPGTSPSFPGMLTGTLPLSHGGLGPLNAGRPRLATEFKRHGFATGGFHSNPFLSTHFNYDTGFDEFKDYQNPLMGVATKIFPRGIEINNPKLQRVDDLINVTGLIKSTYRRVSNKARPYVNAEVITDDSIQWMSQADTPFFCWSHYMDVHHPCYPPAEYRESFSVGDIEMATVAKLYSELLDAEQSLSDKQLQQMWRLYKASIRYVDEQIDRLLEELESTGKLDDTLVVLTSDHGELFGEHGQYGKPERMYDELIQVPLVVLNAPPELESSTDELVSLLDLPPLFHEAVGIETSPEYEGRYPPMAQRDYIIAEHEVDGEPIVGVRSDNWLYEIDQIRDERRLIDVATGLQVDSAEDADSDVDQLKDIAMDRIRALDTEMDPVGDEHLDTEVAARLEDLGYR